MKRTLPLREPGSKNDTDNQNQTRQSQHHSEASSPARHIAPSESQEAAAALATSARPQLLRSPLARVSSLAQDEDDAAPNNPRSGAAPVHARASAVAPPPATPAPPTLSYDARDPSLTRAETTTSGEGTAKGTSSSPIPDEETLAKLRDAVSAKMLLQQRMRTSHDNKRPSPLRDDPELARPLSTISSTSAMTSTSTTSTESAKTIRGSVPTTPAIGAVPLRTPSYPFPYVPGTPRSWSSDFHQPFTTLSPTVSSYVAAGQETPRADSAGMTSGGSTPAAGPAMFAPPGANPQVEDPRFPTPNLYDLVLQLSAEPGLDAWWAAVANIMHDHFKA